MCSLLNVMLWVFGLLMFGEMLVVFGVGLIVLVMKCGLFGVVYFVVDLCVSFVDVMFILMMRFFIL